MRRDPNWEIVFGFIPCACCVDIPCASCARFEFKCVNVFYLLVPLLVLPTLVSLMAWKTLPGTKKNKNASPGFAVIYVQVSRHGMTLAKDCVQRMSKVVPPGVRHNEKTAPEKPPKR